MNDTRGRFKKPAPFLYIQNANVYLFRQTPVTIFIKALIILGRLYN